MWDKDDHFSRWVQGICGVFLLCIFVLEMSMFWRSPLSGLFLVLRYGTVSFVAGYLAYRCLRYAVTGSNCINRDDY